MTSPEPVIVARGLGRTFGKTVVLQGVDLEVCPGEVLGLIGPNGGGKSTLLLLMAGLVRPTAGEVTVDGLPAHRLAQARTGRVGLITAEPGFYPLLTGTENLQFFGCLFGLTPREVTDRATPLIAEMGLENDLARPVSEWSSGMKQKLSLVRALLLDPKVLLLDEPTANLDALSAQTFYVAVRRRAEQGIALVIATHDLVAAERLCDRVA
ncbi:MAG: ABC transporter ATP-binding protein, partial [Deltaproteobacteria bacterium]|nr:ABC transporter ATP-binding protein [Deltaproteobacteria bacterium]